MGKQLSNKEFLEVYHKYLPLYIKDHKGTLTLIKNDNTIPEPDKDGIKGMLMDFKKESTLDINKARENLKRDKDLIKDKVKKQNRQEILDNTDYDCERKGDFEHKGDMSSIYDAYDEYKRDKMNYSVLTKRLQKLLK